MEHNVKDWNLVVQRSAKVWMNLNDGSERIFVAMFILLRDAQEWAKLQNVNNDATYEIEEGTD